MTTTLDRPDVVVSTRRLSNVGPNWYATVMGTGIVATAAATLPHQVRGLHTFALAAWLAAVTLLVAVTAMTATHWLRHPAAARAHLRHPVVGNFYGAMPMALLTVGAGTLLLGSDLIGMRAALAVDWGLWVVGTVGGLVCATLVPLARATGPAFGGWLMPVVPPMVSAATGALLVEHLAPGQARQTMLALCYAMFGFSLVASLVVIVLVWGRLATTGVGPAALVPTLWIVLGPLGQSITAAHLLGAAAAGSPYAGAARAFGLLFGLATWGVAVVWLGIVVALTVRSRPPFGLPWWSFTFPVGTVVTGTSALAAGTGLAVFSWSAGALGAGLVVSWFVVATLTARHAPRLLA